MSAKTSQQRQQYLSPSFETFNAFVDEQIEFVRGSMEFLYDDKGTEYIDCMGMNLCTSIGHAHPAVTEAVCKQAHTLQHCTAMFHHASVGQLAQQLVETMPAHHSGSPYVVHFVNSGAEAIDLACQYARAYTDKSQILSLSNAYHGLHGAGLNTTSINTFVQASSEIDYAHIPFGDDQSLLQQCQNNNIAAILIESTQGYGGVVELPQGYLKQSQQIVNEFGGVLISDEIQTGFGRTGKFWGFEQAEGEVTPDIIVFGKGIANGYPLSGLITTLNIAQQFAESGKFFNTFAGNPVCCSAGIATLNAIANDNIVEYSQQTGKKVLEQLKKLPQDYPLVYKKINGSSGLYYGVCCQSTEIALKVQQQLLKQGVLTGRGGADASVIRFQPPMTIEQTSLDKVIAAFNQAGTQLT